MIGTSLVYLIAKKTIVLIFTVHTAKVADDTGFESKAHLLIASKTALLDRMYLVDFTAGAE